MFAIGLAAADKLEILEAYNAAVTANNAAVVTVFGSDYIDYCKFVSSLGMTAFGKRVRRL